MSLDPDGAPLSAIPPATRMAVVAEGERGPRPATSLIDMKQQSDRARAGQRVDDQTNDSDDVDSPPSRLKRNPVTNPSTINSAPQSQNSSPNMALSLGALPQASTSTSTSNATTPTPAQHPNVRRTREAGPSLRTSSSRRVPKESGSVPTGTLPNTPSDPPRERRAKVRTIPHLPHSPAEPAPPTLMYWSRAPVYGHLPNRNMRAHTVTLAESTAWLFGGCDDKGCAKDVWTFDIETFQWSHPEMTGDLPPPCRAHTSTLVDRRIFIFGGGEGPSYYNSLYILDTVSRKWAQINPPEPLPLPRRAHTAVLYRNKLHIFGGGNGVKALNDVWSLDTSVPVERMRWELLRTQGPKPGPRGYHTANLVGNIMIVIGGSDGRDCFGDIWVLNLDTLIWTLVETEKEYKRLSHTSTQVGSFLFIMGGHDGLKYSQEMLLFNLVTLQFEPKPTAGRPPTARGYHVSLLADGRLFVFGGFDGHSVYDDVWILDLAGAAYLPQVTSFQLLIE